MPGAEVAVPARESQQGGEDQAGSWAPDALGEPGWVGTGWAPWAGMPPDSQMAGCRGKAVGELLSRPGPLGQMLTASELTSPGVGLCSGSLPGRGRQENCPSPPSRW